MTGRHRGTYKLRARNLNDTTQILHIPRPGFMRSSTLLVHNGVIQPFPWLAWPHAKADR